MKYINSVFPVMAAVLLGGGYLFYTFDRATNYQPVTATVTKVEDYCYLWKTERGAVTKTRYETDPGPCDEWEAAKRNDPAYKGFTLYRNASVTLLYISPVDGDYYSGSLKLKKHKDGSWIREGDQLEILAHITEPETISQN